MMLEFSLADKRVRGRSKARRATVVPVASPSIVRLRRAGAQAIANADEGREQDRWRNNRVENTRQPTREGAQDATLQELGLSPRHGVTGPLRMAQAWKRFRSLGADRFVPRLLGVPPELTNSGFLHTIRRRSIGRCGYNGGLSCGFCSSRTI